MAQRFAFGWLMAASLALGCTKQATGPPPVEAVDPHDVPITAADVDMPATYAEAVERVRAYRDLIRDAIAADKPSKAHRPLDELEFVLERLPYLARVAAVPRHQWETVVVAAEDISELFGQVHSAIDEHRAPDYAAVAGRIDDALARLADVAPSR